MPVIEQSAIQSFINALQFEKRYSEHTIAAYANDLQQFFDYTRTQFEGLEIAQISSSFIRSWLASLKEEGLTAKSINRKLSTLKSFFKYLMKTGVIAATPVTNITAPKIGRRLPVYVEKADVNTLLTKVDFPDNWKGRTERLVIEIFYNTGIRLSELVNLRETQVDNANRTLKVLGKGNKERIVPLSTELAASITQYIKEKREQLKEFDNIYLLVNTKGKKLTRGTVYLLVKKYLSQVTTVKKKSPHVLRHSFATHLTNNGAALNSVKELLGHASLAATQVYTHNSIEQLKDIHKKAHPKA